jgi:dTDP-4-dehydrorhamnose reductase
MKNVLVTGADGQLGKCIKDASLSHKNLRFTFASRDDLDITNERAIALYFESNQVNYCINAAAYTNVEKAESDEKNAFKVNAEGVKNLVKACNLNNTTILHVSTDYVFDGKKKNPYTEQDQTGPINVYGASKLKGENAIIEHSEKYFILRTSWLYSQYGHNFFKTILNYAKEGKPLTITTEQIGTPTNANDLVKALIEIILSENKDYGIYNFSNSGEATWYDFAEKIVMLSGHLNKTKLAKTNHYRTFAKRPDYSVLNLDKFESVFNKECVHWEKSLESLLQKINSNS